MRIFRSISSLIALVFATNALYIHAQWVYHNHERGWWSAIKVVVMENILVTVVAIVVVLLVIGIEIYSVKKENDESKATIALLSAVARKLGINGDDVKELTSRKSNYKAVKRRRKND